MEKLVSVIIASFNHEKYIKEAVDSVLNQTYKNIELIVEDDCSSDNTLKILKSIKDDRLKVIDGKRNKGAVKTFNHLLSMCHGEYIGILGSDDVWYEDKIEKQVKCLEEKKVDAVFSMMDVIDQNGDIYESDGDFNKDVFRIGNMSRGKRMRLFYEVGNHLCHPSSLITKKAIEKIGFYNPAYRQLHDFEYWVRLVNEFDIYVMDEKLLGYRRFREGNLSSNTVNNSIRVINEHYSVIDNMFKNIDDKIFIDGFKDLFINKDSTSKDELFCEKFLLLLKFDIFGVINKNIALNMLFNCENIDIIIDKLKEEYNYSINDFYKDSGDAYKLYPLDLYLEANDDLKEIINKKDGELENARRDANELRIELNNIYSSKSWVVTKPLRKFMEMIKK